MLNMRTNKQSGTSMVEVLVSIVIVVLGLLGLAGLQSHASLAEAEAFQRAQAIVLLKDMTDRLNASRLQAADFKTATPLGTGTADVCDGKIGADLDKCEWSNALLGASESAGGVKVGAMTDARGCITETVTTMPREYEITVVWQGITPSKAPTNLCGTGLYGDERYRRSLTTTVRIGCLQNDPATNACTFPR
jgi:type IV pilus assembly protein PilV